MNHDHDTLLLHGSDAPLAHSQEEPATPRTGHPSPTTTTRFFVTLAVSNRPRCPSCGGKLLPKAVRIHRGICWCDNCPSMNEDAYVNTLLALESRIGPSELSRSRGVTFWTPPSDLSMQDCYIRWMVAVNHLAPPTQPLTVEYLEEVWNTDPLYLSPGSVHEY